MVTTNFCFIWLWAFSNWKTVCRTISISWICWLTSLWYCQWCKDPSTRGRIDTGIHRNFRHVLLCSYSVVRAAWVSNSVRTWSNNSVRRLFVDGPNPRCELYMLDIQWWQGSISQVPVPRVWRKEKRKKKEKEKSRNNRQWKGSAGVENLKGKEEGYCEAYE